MLKSLVLLGIGILFPAASVNGEMTPSPRDPVRNFEHVWNRLDRNYAQFGVKQADWDALYRVYRPQVTDATTDQELWDILVMMLLHLNDAHVCLADDARRVCSGLTEGVKYEDFSLGLVKSKYLQGEPQEALKGKFVWGWLDEAIGYLYIADLKGGLDPIIQTIDSVIPQLAGARGVVLDVRGNTGGGARAAQAVAARFADRMRHYVSVQTRYGPKRGDLTPADPRNVAPGGAVQYLGPTILLTNRATASAAEDLLLAMRVLPHVTVVGDLTEGALSSQFPDRLLNGWTLFVAFKVARDHNGVCWDGVGVPPDLRMVNTAADIGAGRDRVLELAIQLLQKGAPAPQDESASLVNLKASLVDEYVQRTQEEGAEVAVAELSAAHAAGGANHYFSMEEAMQQAGVYLGSKEYDAAIGLLQAAQKDFPQVAGAYAWLASAYLGLGDVAAAEAIMKTAERVEAMFPWEETQLEQTKTAIRKQKFGSAAVLVGKALADGGASAAERVFSDLLIRRDKERPVFDEADFNALGYRLFQENKLEHAIFVFEKNVQLCPESANAYDSLGEALAKAGRREEAIESYRKSLSLDARNPNAKSMLQELENAQ